MRNILAFTNTNCAALTGRLPHLLCTTSIHIALQNLFHVQYSSENVPYLLSSSLHYFCIYYNFCHYGHTQSVY